MGLGSLLHDEGPDRPFAEAAGCRLPAAGWSSRAWPRGPVSHTLELGEDPQPQNPRVGPRRGRFLGLRRGDSSADVPAPPEACPLVTGLRGAEVRRCRAYRTALRRHRRPRGDCHRPAFTPTLVSIGWTRVRVIGILAGNRHLPAQRSSITRCQKDVRRPATALFCAARCLRVSSHM
jgi:hypothetical protein